MEDYTLTGFCADYDIIKPFIACVEYREEYESPAAVIEACIDSWIAALNNEIEYTQTPEYFAELSAANDWQYTESGDFFAC